MFIQVKELCGKFFSQVRNSYANGFDILFESPEYLTEAMALADAKCWLAFHGGNMKCAFTYVTVTGSTGHCGAQVMPGRTVCSHHQGENMDKVTVDPAEVYTARQAVTGIFAEVPAANVARAVASAYEHGMTVEVKDGAMGQRYIEISNGKGSAYSQWHIGADFRDKMVRKYTGNTMLTPAGIETLTRTEYYGSPAYFGKVEWFDAVDRETNELLPFRVSRVDQYEITVNGPKGLILTGLASLRAAAEAIQARR